MSQPAPDKFARYRARKKAAGMKEVRIWTEDPATPSFAERARQEAERLRGAPEEIEALEFIEAVMADLDLPDEP